MESEETDPGLDLRVAWSRGRPVAFPGSPLSQAAASAGIAGLREDPLRRRACGWVGARVLHIPAGLELLNTVALGTGSHTSLALAQGQESRPAPQAPPSAGLPRSPFPQLHPPALPQTRSREKGPFSALHPKKPPHPPEPSLPAAGRGTGGAQAWDALPRSASLHLGSGMVVLMVRGSFAGSPATAELCGVGGRAWPTQGERPD